MILTEPSSIKKNSKEWHAFQWFLQEVINRSLVGGIRYGPIDKRKQYLSRLKKELKAYIADGNREQLLNIAVYAFLESYAPENKKYHVNEFADSVTRGTFGV